MRIIVADCSAHYEGRLNATLPPARRVILIKADNSLLIFSELGSYKPLNWMAAPCVIKEIRPEESDFSNIDNLAGAHVLSDVHTLSDVHAPSDVHTLSSVDTASDVDVDTNIGVEAAGPADGVSVTDTDEISDSDADDDLSVELIIRASAQKSNDVLEVTLYHIVSDTTVDLGVDPGLTKDGVEDHLQDLLSKQMDRVGDGVSLVRREYPTAIGPVDIMGVSREGQHIAIEIKRNGGIDGVEQLTRYIELLNRDPLIAPVQGVFAAQTISPQARILAEDRGFKCLILDYEEMKGAEDGVLRLF